MHATGPGLALQEPQASGSYQGPCITAVYFYQYQSCLTKTVPFKSVDSVCNAKACIKSHAYSSIPCIALIYATNDHEQHLCTARHGCTQNGAKTQQEADTQTFQGAPPPLR